MPSSPFWVDHLSTGRRCPTPSPYWHQPFRLLLLVAACLVPILAACTATASLLPSTYATDDATHLALLSWQQSDQDLSGTWLTWSRENPTPHKTLFSGHVQESTVSLIVSNSVLQGSDAAGRLTLMGNTLGGQFQNASWVALSQAQARQVSVAFVQETSLYNALQQLQETLAAPASDSDPYRYAEQVQSAQASVLHLQQQAKQLLAQGNPCGSATLLSVHSGSSLDETFTLSPVQLPLNSPQQNAQLVTKASTLQAQVQATQSAWLTAQRAPLPALPLTFAWRSPATTVRTQLTQGQRQLTLLQDALTSDFTSMRSLQAQAQHLLDEITARAQQYGC